MSIDNRTIETLRNGLSRIFAMKVTKSTFREVQNLILALTGGKEDDADSLLQALVGTDHNDAPFTEDSAEKVRVLAREYAIPVRLSKEVLERGEFLNLLTSDTIGSNKGPLLLNRIRRIDGEEFQFISDANSTVHMLQHFTSRMNELTKTDEGRQSLKEVKQGLENAQQLLTELLSS
jgi:hypothetical protein